MKLVLFVVFLKSVYLTLAVCLSLVAWAEVRFERRASEESEIFAFSDSCKNIDSQVRALLRLAHSSTNKKNDLSCYKKSIASSSGQCTREISECLPRQIKNNHDRYPQVYGPNCWNAAMVTVGILPFLRVSLPEEMSFFMSSPLCRRIADSEKKRPGDIGSIKEITGEELHSYVYITDELVYSKNGAARNPYRLQPLEEVLALELSCASGRKECERQVLYYRCQSIESYFEKNSKDLSWAFLLQNKFNAFDKVVSHMAFSLADFNSEKLFLALSLLENFSIELETVKEKIGVNHLSKENDKREFILKSFVFRAKSLASQLSFYGTPDTQKKRLISSLIEKLENL